MNGSPNDDIYKLIRFLKDSEDVLEHLIAEPEGLLLKRITKNKRLYDSLNAAWEDVRKNLELVVQKLHKPQLHDSSDLKSIPDQLEDVGLTGKQLEFKLHLFYWLMKRWQAERTRNWIVRVLGAMNTILGSLVKVFAQIEPVKEFKEAIEQIVRMK